VPSGALFVTCQITLSARPAIIPESDCEPVWDQKQVLVQKPIRDVEPEDAGWFEDPLHFLEDLDHMLDVFGQGVFPTQHHKLGATLRACATLDDVGGVTVVRARDLPHLPIMGAMPVTPEQRGCAGKNPALEVGNGRDHAVNALVCQFS
jgi:hypothetical protein